MSTNAKPVNATNSANNPASIAPSLPVNASSNSSNKSRPQFKYQDKPIAVNRDYMDFDTVKDLHDLVGIPEFGDLYLDTQRVEVFTYNDYSPNDDKYFYIRWPHGTWILTPVGYKLETAKTAASTFIYLWLRGIPENIAANLAVTNALIGKVNNHDLTSIAKKHLDYARRPRVGNSNVNAA